MAFQANTSPQANVEPTNFLRNPWVQLIAGIVAMVMIANLQYGWSLFVVPIHGKYGWTKAEIQVAFSIFVLVETWLFPVETYLVDRFGPRWVIFAGGILTGLAWIVDANASSLGMLYFGGVLAGIGTGLVYGTCVTNALKWFGARRGLATGLTAAGFGAGAAVTVIPISNVIASQGYQAAFLQFGILQGVVILIASLFIRVAPRSVVTQVHNLSPKVLVGKRDATPGEALRTPIFWLMYVMFVFVSVGGLIAIANLGPIAKDYNIAKVPVSLFGITLVALTFATSLSDVMNGLTRVVSGWASDGLGREPVMAVVFTIEAIGIFCLGLFGHNPVLFVLFAGTVYFGYGEIFSLFPSATRDHWGYKYGGTNYGLLYTAKGTASLLIPVAAVIVHAGGAKNWAFILGFCGVLNLIAALLAVTVLRPMRKADIARQEAEVVPMSVSNPSDSVRPATAQ